MPKEIIEVEVRVKVYFDHAGFDPERIEQWIERSLKAAAHAEFEPINGEDHAMPTDVIAEVM